MPDFNPTKFLEGVKTLTPEERGCYITVVALLYRDGGPAPDDPKALAAVCGMSTKAWTRVRQSLLDLGKLRLVVTGTVACLTVGAGGAVDRPAGERVLDAEQSQGPTVRAFMAWNELATRCGLPRADILSAARKRKIASRLKEGGLARWAKALAAVEASDFCRGRCRPRPGQDRPFRADLDFMLQADSYDRLTSGFYGGQDDGPTGNGEELRWRSRVRQWIRDPFTWDSAYGPAPDQPDTEVPDDVLQGLGLSRSNVIPLARAK